MYASNRAYAVVQSILWVGHVGGQPHVTHGSLCRKRWLRVLYCITIKTRWKYQRQEEVPWEIGTHWQWRSVRNSSARVEEGWCTLLASHYLHTHRIVSSVHPFCRRLLVTCSKCIQIFVIHQVCLASMPLSLVFRGCHRQPLYCFHFVPVVWLHVTDI